MKKFYRSKLRKCYMNFSEILIIRLVLFCVITVRVSVRYMSGFVDNCDLKLCGKKPQEVPSVPV